MPLEGVSLHNALQRCPHLPPLGALVYPRWRVATLLTAGAIEFHCLGGVLHCGVDAAAWYRAMGLEPPGDAMRLRLRGAWSDAGVFFPDGYAITDWEYGAGTEAWRRYLRRQRARARGMRVIGGPRVGDAGRYGGRVVG